MDAVSPVIPELKNYEVNVGSVNDESAAKALHSVHGIFVMRWTFTKEERERIAAGEDIYLSQFSGQKAPQAVKPEVGMPHETPENFKRVMRLDDDFELRALHVQATEAQAAMEKRQMEVLKGDEEVNRLAQSAQQAKKNLDLRLAEVFSGKPVQTSVIQVVN